MDQQKKNELTNAITDTIITALKGEKPTASMVAQAMAWVIAHEKRIVKTPDGDDARLQQLREQAQQLRALPFPRASQEPQEPTAAGQEQPTTEPVTAPDGRVGQASEWGITRYVRFGRDGKPNPVTREEWERRRAERDTFGLQSPE